MSWANLKTDGIGVKLMPVSAAYHSSRLNDERSYLRVSTPILDTSLTPSSSRLALR